MCRNDVLRVKCECDGASVISVDTHERIGSRINDSDSITTNVTMVIKVVILAVERVIDS